MDFNLTLESGREVERAFAIKMLSKCSDIEKIEFAPDMQFKDWDVKISGCGKETTYEVKRDFKSQETGNIAIEFRCNNKPSGIFASKADYIIYCLSEDEFYWQNRGELLYRLYFLEKKTVNGGDGDRAEMFLINKGDLYLLFNRL